MTSSGPRIGSLFSGYGGLDEGVRQVIGGEVQWFVEFDKAPSAILSHHWPDVPNFGDVTSVDWDAVPPVDVLTGGFPCQDVSLAGLRRGLQDGTRSGLWSEFARAIDKLRPRLVVIENVRGLLSAEANRGLESDPWGVGNRPDGPALRALGAVLGDLADIGYDAEWCGVRAADAGAPHGRYRVFVVAYPAGQPWRFGDGDDVRPGSGEERRQSTAGASPAEDADKSVGRERWKSTPREASGRWARADTGRRSGALVVADPCSARLGEHPGESPSQEAGAGNRNVASGSGGPRPDKDWGPYSTAIARWEKVTGLVAPSPTAKSGRSSAERLSPAFVEWMMGLVPGHVTGTGISRADQLKALGNGVVPQQAALAVRALLGQL